MVFNKYYIVVVTKLITGKKNHTFLEKLVEGMRQVTRILFVVDVSRYVISLIQPDEDLI